MAGKRWEIRAGWPSSRAWPSGHGPSVSLPKRCRSAIGTRRVYRLNPVGVAALRDQLETFWNRALDGYQDVVEQETEEKS